MTIKYFLILLLPAILHSKGNIAVLVFLIMNSIISILMEYTKIEIKMLGHMIENRDKIEELLNDEVEYDESFKEHLAKEDIYLPKPIEFAANISMTINIVAILIGLVKIIINII